MLMLCLSIYGMKLFCSDFIDAAALAVRPETIDWTNAITSASVLGNLAILQFLSIKSYIPFSPQVCGGLVLYFSFTSLSIVLGLFLQLLHNGLFIFLYRHLYRRPVRFSGGAFRRSLQLVVRSSVFRCVLS